MAFAKVGYGQVEPNHLSAMRTGQIYAQLPVSGAMFAATGACSGGLQNGMFVKYDTASGAVRITSASGLGEWMLVMNEVKLYEVGKYAKDFVLASGDFVDGVVTPRVYKTNVGDIITTNMVDTAGTYAAGNTLIVNTTTGVLEAGTDTSFMWKVAKVTTMPDGSPGLKIQRVV